MTFNGKPLTLKSETDPPPPPPMFSPCSKMNADKRVESPIPILPLSTPDAETEKLIKMKDEEVSRTAAGV